MIISFNRYNGGGGSGSGVTPQEVQAQIDSALTPYWNSAATESAITQSVSGKADAAGVEANTSMMYFPAWNSQGIVQGTIGSEVYNRELKINGDAKSYFTNTQYFSNLNFYAPESAGTAGDILVSVGSGAPVWSAVTMPDMTAYTPTSGFSTINGSAITNGGNIVIQGGGGDMSNYWNSAETKSYVDSAATNLQDQIDTMDEVVSDALNDLNGELANKVSSSSVSTIWKGTQAQYDAIVTKDPATFYIIVSSN